MHLVLQEIYLLVSKVGFSGEYVDHISPGERKMFILYYDKEQEEKRKAENPNSGIGGMTATDPLMGGAK